MAIRLILIYDKRTDRVGIRARIEKHKDFQLVDEASTVDEALEKIRCLRPDVIVLDVRSIDSPGLEVARMLDRHHDRLVLVFLAGYRDRAFRALDMEAPDYLLKPVEEKRFEQTLERIRESRLLHRAAQVEGLMTSRATPSGLPAGSGTTGRIAVRHGKKTRLLEMIEIEWIKADGDYSELHVAGNGYLCREPLSALLTRLPSELFYRIHRSIVVNVSNVLDFSTRRNLDLEITMKDGTILRASRTFSGELRKALTQQ